MNGVQLQKVERENLVDPEVMRNNGRKRFGRVDQQRSMEGTVVQTSLYPFAHLLLPIFFIFGYTGDPEKSLLCDRI